MNTAADNYKVTIHKSEWREKQQQGAFEQLTTIAGQLRIEDIKLLPSGEMEWSSEPDTDVFLLPIAGALNISQDILKTQVQPEEVYATTLHNSLHVSNPLADTAINFLRIVCKRKRSRNRKPVVGNIALGKKNALTSVGLLNKNISIGFFDSRQKGVYTPDAGSTAVNVFIINGSFEAEDRLLEYRDALTLESCAEIGFEALAESSILLIIE